MFKLYSQLPKSKEALREHIKALTKLTEDHEHRDLFDHLYSCLSILDSKSSSLLTFNSIIIAVYAIFLSGNLRLVEWIPISVGMSTILISCFLLLSVVWVHWSTTGDLLDVEQHAFSLLQVRRIRTIKYRLAWYLAVAALGFLIFFLVLRCIP